MLAIDLILLLVQVNILNFDDVAANVSCLHLLCPMWVVGTKDYPIGTLEVELSHFNDQSQLRNYPFPVPTRLFHP